MKVTIVEDPNIKETEISIVCEKMTNEINDIVSKISAVGLTVAGKKDEETFLIPIKEIFYFESVDGKIFFCTENEIYEAMAKIYKIEESLKNLRFSRISKTVIANLDKMLSIRKAENSRLVATLVNQEKLVVSRQYVSEIKKKLGVQICLEIVGVLSCTVWDLQRLFSLYSHLFSPKAFELTIFITWYARLFPYIYFPFLQCLLNSSPNEFG